MRPDPRIRPLPRRALPSVLAVALALLAGGCASTATTKGAGSFHGEQAIVASTVSDFQSAARNRDASKLCKQLLDPALTAQLHDSGGGCTHVLGNQLNTIENYDLTIESIEVSGTTATARVKSISNGNTHFDTLKLTKVGSAWRVSGLG